MPTTGVHHLSPSKPGTPKIPITEGDSSESRSAASRDSASDSQKAKKKEQKIKSMVLPGRSEYREINDLRDAIENFNKRRKVTNYQKI